MKTDLIRFSNLRRLGFAFCRRIDERGYVLNVYLWSRVWRVWA